MKIQRVVVASHVFAFGTSQGFFDYCRRKGFDTVFIGHKLFGNPLTWTIGAIDTMLRVVKSGKIYDLYFGSNNLNAAIGILLRAVGRVRRVVYFSPDWVIDRFPSAILNWLYRWLDYFCVKNADMTWNSSAIMPMDPMMRERERRGYSVDLRSKQIQVSDGTEIISLPVFRQISRFKIGFIGHLRAGMGVEMLIAAMPIILEKIPRATLLIMGSGPLEQKFREQARGLPIEFTGFMGDINEVYRKLSYCAVAVAPYEPGTISQYTDPGKVKSYLTAGLPIVITKVPMVAYEIDKKRAGFAVAGYDPKDFAAAVVRLLVSKDKLLAYRKNALKLRDEYSWDKIFDRALSILDKSIASV